MTSCFNYFGARRCPQVKSCTLCGPKNVDDSNVVHSKDGGGGGGGCCGCYHGCEGSDGGGHELCGTAKAVGTGWRVPGRVADVVASNLRLSQTTRGEVGHAVSDAASGCMSPERSGGPSELLLGGGRGQ